MGDGGEQLAAHRAAEEGGAGADAGGDVPQGPYCDLHDARARAAFERCLQEHPECHLAAVSYAQYLRWRQEEMQNSCRARARNWVEAASLDAGNAGDEDARAAWAGAGAARSRPGRNRRTNAPLVRVRAARQPGLTVLQRALRYTEDKRAAAALHQAVGLWYMREGEAKAAAVALRRAARADPDWCGPVLRWEQVARIPVAGEAPRGGAALGQY